MSLFGKKKEEKTAPACACNGDAVEMQSDNMDTPCCMGKNSQDGICCGESTADICCIKVLGAGCKSCNQLYENVQEAVKNMELDLSVEYVTDMEKVVSYGVLSTPAIVVNEKVVSMGKVLKVTDVEKLFHKLGY